MNVEVRAKRTSKETETKERDRGGARDPQKGRRGGAHQGLIDYFAEQWSRVIGGGAKYPFAKGKDGTAAKRILESVNGDLGRARRMVDAYLSDPDPYLKGRGKGRGLALLAGHVRLPMYIAETASRTNAGAGHARPVEHPIVSECRERWPADVMAHLADYLSIAARVEAGRLVGKVVKQSDAKDGPAFRLECHTEGKTRAG